MIKSGAWYVAIVESRKQEELGILNPLTGHLSFTFLSFHYYVLRKAIITCWEFRCTALEACWLAAYR